MLKRERRALKGPSIVEWCMFKTDGHGLWPFLYCEQQQALSIGLIEITRADSKLIANCRSRRLNVCFWIHDKGIRNKF